ncbi:hypothetical protein M378DRAFT_156644 [Amanita muscaria Koide BX008]|uniref:F-box domain-containing protein n=1 Tax=Amanita muscaria (strain Koide BX008) TaxID=946122 RepID=A0A0C2XN00_AMAMK|nr:hypothetical protein M378DRAFT_156644 [Amanita muscaria Koide BX008]
MDSKTTTLATPGPLDAMFRNATIDKAERNEFNSARGMFNCAVNNTFNLTKQGENLVLDCVSLENNVLEESGSPALQAPLTPPDDDYISVPATISPTLPRELVERTLLLLDTKSVLKCRLVNREFNAIIQSSTLLQYYLACTAAGVVDNPQSPLSYAERLDCLSRTTPRPQPHPIPL